MQIALVFQDPMTALNPVVRDRAPDHRVAAPAGRARPQGRLRDGGGAAHVGGHPLARAAPAQLPPRAVGRHAPAGHDRHRPGLRAQAPPGRRAHHRARRHRPGPDPRPAGRPAARAPHGHDPRHPRPRRGGQPHRRDRRHVRRAGRRAGAHRRALRPHPHALHRGAAALDPPPGRAVATPACAPSRAGPPTSPRDLQGCRFAPRCPYAQDHCRKEEPPLRTAGPGTPVPVLVPGGLARGRRRAGPQRGGPGPRRAGLHRHVRCATRRMVGAQRRAGQPDGRERHRPPARRATCCCGSSTSWSSSARASTGCGPCPT